MPGGRPTGYSEEIADEICARIMDGASLRTVCRAADMPDTTTVNRWLRLHPEFSLQYARAREDRADAHVEDMLEIADDEKGDVQRDKLRVDARKWAASKMKPKQYGDRQQVDMTVKDDRDDDELVHEAREMAKRLGIDPATIPVLAGKR